MTQGRDGISWAHARALELRRVARQLSLGAAVFLIAALVAGTAGSSYAKSMKSGGPELLDTVVVSNFGASFGGTLETFVAGSVANAKPFKKVTGTNTLLSGTSNGPAGDAQSSLFNGQIAVAMPLQLLPFTPFLKGWVELFPAGANGNSQPDALIASPTGFGAKDYTGLDLPEGVAYRNPFVCVDGGTPAGASVAPPTVTESPDLIAVSNFAVAVVDPPDFNPFDSVFIGLCAPAVGPGFSLGTITEYHTNFEVHTGPGVGPVSDCVVDLPGLSTFSPPFNGINDICPHNNSPVNFGTQNATIGGCATFLFGPIGVAFDWAGYLYVVNEAGTGTALGTYVTVYAPGASGNVLPVAVIGLIGATAGDLIDAQYITVSSLGDPLDPVDDVILVTDRGDNSIKVFEVFTNFSLFADSGTEIGVIKGGKTKLKGPEGIASDVLTNTFVVSENGNSLEEFEDLGDSCCATPPALSNIPPTFILSGAINRQGPGMNLPIGVALPEFSPLECSVLSSAEGKFSKK